MMCTDPQPMSEVENCGFKNVLKKARPKYKMPSRTYFSNTILPDIYERSVRKIKEAISEPSFISFTTVILIFRPDNNNEIFISLTAHWVSNEFEFKYLYLYSQALPGSHTAQNIAIQMKKMLENWEISSEKIHAVLRDNAVNKIIKNKIKYKYKWRKQ